MIRLLSVAVFWVLATGCQALLKDDPDQFECVEPRPEICTREFNPVCGVNLENTFRTYPTSCVACSSSKVSSYSKGRCPEVL